MDAKKFRHSAAKKIEICCKNRKYLFFIKKNVKKSPYNWYFDIKYAILTTIIPNQTNRCDPV